MRVLIRGGRVIDPASGLDAQADVAIAEGRIAAVGRLPESFTSDLLIEAEGKVVCPGLVDLHARLREPGQEHKGTIASETRAASGAGITTLCCPPDTDPVVDTPAVAEQIIHRAGRLGYARVHPLAALTLGLAGEQLSEMHELKEVGCLAMSNARRPVTNTLVMRRAMEYAATLGLTVFLTAEDPWLGKNGCVHEGRVSTRLGLPGIPDYAEAIAVSRDLMLVEQTGVSAHFMHLSTARAVEMIAHARERGLPVSADVSAHQLHLTEVDVGHFDSQCHVRPPLRTQRDRDALRRGVAAGIISAICSDHQPHDRDAKLAPFATTEPGISALDTLLPLTLRLADEEVMSISDAIASLTLGPAKILAIDAGTLRAGSVADICIFDPRHRWRLTEADLLSHGKNTPFIGWELQGKVTQTLLGGKLVFDAEQPSRIGPENL